MIGREAPAGEVRFQEESWARYYADAGPLWPEHYEELCTDKVRMAMSPDVQFYQTMAASGFLQIVTARAAGRLVGYVLSVIRPHSHYSNVLCGFEDAFWLDPEYRRGMTGARLVREAVKAMRRRGVQKVFFQSNLALPRVTRLFDYLGFKQTHITHSLWIGD